MEYVEIGPVRHHPGPGLAVATGSGPSTAPGTRAPRSTACSRSEQPARPAQRRPPGDNECGRQPTGPLDSPTGTRARSTHVAAHLGRAGSLSLPGSAAIGVLASALDAARPASARGDTEGASESDSHSARVSRTSSTGPALGTARRQGPGSPRPGGGRDRRCVGWPPRSRPPGRPEDRRYTIRRLREERRTRLRRTPTLARLCRHRASASTAARLTRGRRVPRPAHHHRVQGADLHCLLHVCRCLPLRLQHAAPNAGPNAAPAANPFGSYTATTAATTRRRTALTPGADHTRHRRSHNTHSVAKPRNPASPRPGRLYTAPCLVPARRPRASRAAAEGPPEPPLTRLDI